MIGGIFTLLVFLFPMEKNLHVKAETKYSLTDEMKKSIEKGTLSGALNKYSKIKKYSFNNSNYLGGDFTRYDVFNTFSTRSPVDTYIVEKKKKKIIGYNYYIRSVLRVYDHQFSTSFSKYYGKPVYKSDIAKNNGVSIYQTKNQKYFLIYDTTNYPSYATNKFPSDYSILAVGTKKGLSSQYSNYSWRFENIKSTKK